MPAVYDDLGLDRVLPVSAFTSENEQIFPYEPLEMQISPLKGPSVLQPRRQGAFQQWSNQFDYIAKNGLGQMSFTTSALFGVPAPTRESPLLFTPTFQIMWLDGPTATELPARLYSSALQIQWLKQFNPRWGMALSVTPGVYGDYEHLTGDAFRIPGYAGLKWTYSPTLSFAFGVVYFDREDVGWIPAVGLIWQPTPDLLFDLIPPKPRIAWRFYCHDCVEQWLFLGGEFGGGSWQIERTGGVNDQVAIGDYRLLLGLERKRNGWPVSRFEVGWVFGRKVEYASGLPDFEPGDSVLIRGVVIF